MVSHRRLADYLDASHPSDCVDRAAFRAQWRRWDEFVVDAFGIQVLTDKHLARANRVDAWTTTRVDAHHYLVEARDLGPWYGKPLAWRDRLDPVLLQQARNDFGEMILTPAVARREGVS